MILLVDPDQTAPSICIDMSVQILQVFTLRDSTLSIAIGFSKFYI